MQLPIVNNAGPMLHRFRDVTDFLLKTAHYPHFGQKSEKSPGRNMMHSNYSFVAFQVTSICPLYVGSYGTSSLQTDEKDRRTDNLIELTVTILWRFVQLASRS